MPRSNLDTMKRAALNFFNQSNLQLKWTPSGEPLEMLWDLRLSRGPSFTRDKEHPLKVPSICQMETVMIAISDSCFSIANKSKPRKRRSAFVSLNLNCAIHHVWSTAHQQTHDNITMMSVLIDMLNPDEFPGKKKEKKEKASCWFELHNTEGNCCCSFQMKPDLLKAKVSGKKISYYRFLQDLRWLNVSKWKKKQLGYATAGVQV